MMHRKLEHATNTWKGRIQRELLDLSAKRANKPLIYRSSNPTFMQTCKDKGLSIERGDWLRTKPIHPTKVVGRQRSASAKGLIYKEPRWQPMNDANPDVNQNTETKPKAPPPKPPGKESEDKEPIV